MKSLWTKKYLLEMILSRMSIEPGRTIPRQLDQIGAQLGQSGRPLIIDEADLIINKGMIEVVRDIYESSQGTVILVGEENLPSHLERIERIHGRMLDWVAAQPTDINDARKFAELNCRGVKVADCLLTSIIESAKGAARLICTNLARVSEFARMNNLNELDSKAYTGTLFTGKAPARRAL